MNLADFVESVGKLAFGITSLGLIGYLIKLVTEINKNQKMQNAVIKEQFAEREKTRELEIAFLREQKDIETGLLRNKLEAITETMEGEKRILEQRLALHAEQRSIRDAGGAQVASSELRVELINHEENRVQQDAPLLFVHAIKAALIPLTRSIETMFDRNEATARQLAQLGQNLERVNLATNMLGFASDPGILSLESISITDLLARIGSRFEDLELVVSDSVVGLPVIFTDPQVLFGVVLEVFENARRHGSEKRLYVDGQKLARVVQLTFSNRCAYPTTARHFELPHLQASLRVIGGNLRSFGGGERFHVVIELPLLARGIAEPVHSADTDKTPLR